MCARVCVKRKKSGLERFYELRQVTQRKKSYMENEKYINEAMSDTRNILKRFRRLQENENEKIKKTKEL